MGKELSGDFGLGVFYIVLGTILLIIFSITLKEYFAILTRGIETKARILEFYREISSTSNTPDFYVRISYFAPDPKAPTTNPLHPGKMYFGREMVTQKFWDTHNVGNEVPILYLPENPATRILKVGKPRAEFLGQIFAIILGVWAIGTGSYLIVKKGKKVVP